MGYWRAHHDAILALRMIRADGSVFHMAQLDEEGRLHYYTTAQGLLPTTTWSRAQAWAMHGFTTAYESSGEPRYLEAALRLGDWWVGHQGGDPVPIYDRADEEGPKRPKDSCAAAMAANTLVRLAEAAPHAAPRYRAAVEATVRELIHWYLSDAGVLLHGSWGFRREQVTHGIAPRRLRFPQEDVMPYGNYFIVELLYRELGCDMRPFRLAGS